GEEGVGRVRGRGCRRVRHYRGGLKEWTESERDAPPAAAPAIRQPVDRPPRRDRATRRVLRMSGSVRFIDALADRSVAELFNLWLAIVGACGLVYWLLALAIPSSLSTSTGAVGSGVLGL